MSTQMPDLPGKEQSKLKGCLIVVAVLIVLGIIVSRIDNTQVPRQDDASTGDSQAAIYLEMYADSLYAEYEQNEVAADNKYKNNTVIVTGSIQDIGKDILDTPYVIVGGKGFLDGVQCMFGKKDLGEIGRLKKDAPVKIQGKVSGKMGNVLLQNCKLR